MIGIYVYEKGVAASLTVAHLCVFSYIAGKVTISSVVYINIMEGLRRSTENAPYVLLHTQRATKWRGVSEAKSIEFIIIVSGFLAVGLGLGIFSALAE